MAQFIDVFSDGWDAYDSAVEYNRHDQGKSLRDWRTQALRELELDDSIEPAPTPPKTKTRSSRRKTTG